MLALGDSWRAEARMRSCSLSEYNWMVDVRMEWGWEYSCEAGCMNLGNSLD